MNCSGALARPDSSRKPYVLSHEIGHHIQNLLGIEQKVRSLRQVESWSGESVVGADGIAGRLLCRDLGEEHAAAKSARGWRRGERDWRGFGGG